jgi:hypothetical protein
MKEDIERGGVKYLVKWNKNQNKENSYVHESEFRKGSPLITAFENNPNKQSWEVEAIVGMKEGKKQRKFLVKWKGFPEEDCSWQTEKQCFGCLEIVERYIATLQLAESRNDKKNDKYELRSMKLYTKNSHYSQQ